MKKLSNSEEISLIEEAVMLAGYDINVAGRIAEIYQLLNIDSRVSVLEEVVAPKRDKKGRFLKWKKS